MEISSQTVYIKGGPHVEVTEPSVVLCDLLQLECADREVLQKLKNLPVVEFSDREADTYHGNARRVVSILKLIEIIHSVFPELAVQNLGESDIIVTYTQQKTSGIWIHWLKVAAVMSIAFSGSAFSIMAFNNDIDSNRLFGHIYELVMGRPSDGFTLLEVTYSVGIVIGILVFFNHFGQKRFSEDPTPMEVEMRLYEKDIETTVVENISRKGKELDVGEADIVGHHRS